VKASEVKVAFMVFQESPPRVSPIEIISAQPQSNNAPSSFTRDIVSAAARITLNVKSTCFLNIVVDGFSFETIDVMTIICQFLYGF
jgi:hypothetical protein